MINDTKVTKTNARILARQLARSLTDEEIDRIAGGMISHGEAGGVSPASARHTPTTYSVCPGNDADT